MVSLKGMFLVLHFSYFTLMTFLMKVPVILKSMLMILVSTLIAIRHLVLATTRVGSELESDLQDTVDWTESSLFISVLEKLSLFVALV